MLPQNRIGGQLIENTRLLENTLRVKSLRYCLTTAAPPTLQLNQSWLKKLRVLPDIMINVWEIRAQPSNHCNVSFENKVSNERGKFEQLWERKPMLTNMNPATTLLWLTFIQTWGSLSEVPSKSFYSSKSTWSFIWGKELGGLCMVR